MEGLDDAVLGLVDKTCFGMSEVSPQDEDNASAQLADLLDDGVRELLPAIAGMRVGAVSPGR